MTPRVLPSPIGFLLLPQFTSIALSSAIEPLRIANRYVQQKYSWRLLSLNGAAVPDGNGMLIQPESSFLRCGSLGTLFLLADIRPERFYSSSLRAWLHGLDHRGVTLGSMDTSCFILARAGLLRGHRVTPHWEVLDSFRERFPDCDISPTLFHIGDRRMSSAGGSSVLDMMLRAIEMDHGEAIANRVAEHCLVNEIRCGDSWQRMALPLRTGAHHPRLVRALQLIEDNPETFLSVAALSDELKMSTRHLLRLFRDHIGETPHHYLMRIRLERARGMLQQTDLSITAVAEAGGYGSVAHFSRAFRRQFGRPPSTGRKLNNAKALLMDSDK